jgi:serine/threonine-protein kinase
VDARTDVYAASVIAWELATGQRLFSADSDFATAHKVLNRPVDAPTRIVPEIPDALSDVILRGLARDPEERFPSALDAAEALERAVPSASPSDVARVATDLCQPQLDELERLVLLAETRDAEAKPSERRSGRRWAWAAAAGGIAVLAGWGVATRGGSTSHLASFPPIPPAPIVLPVPTATAEPSVAAAPSAAPPTAIRVPRPAPKTAPSASAPTPAPDCDPPYVVDKNGFHHMKPECLAR